jgi:hypothetical protein
MYIHIKAVTMGRRVASVKYCTIYTHTKTRVCHGCADENIAEGESMP